MKRLVLTLTLAALAAMSVRAQDNHHGPVVYPTNSAPETLAPDTNAIPGADAASAPAVVPAAPGGNSVILPPPDATSAMTTNATPATAPSDTAPATAPSADTAPSTPPPADASAPDNSISVTPSIAPSVAPATAPSSTISPAGLAPLQNMASSPGAANGGKPDDIYDIRPPYFYMRPLTWLWFLLGAIALAAIIAALWIWFKPLRVLRAKSAYELALEKLEKARALLDEKNPEPYAVLVSETVRSYLGQRFHTPSTRRTTEEFLRQMQSDTNTPLAEHRDLLRHFLEACDLVKFAHYEPGREELEQVQQRAVSFVTATRPMEGAPA